MHTNRTSREEYRLTIDAVYIRFEIVMMIVILFAVSLDKSSVNEH